MSTLADHRLLHAHLAAPRWWVAFSGGVDSTVLLHWLLVFARSRAVPPIHALHVHHGLQVEADAWAQHCRTICAALSVPLRVERVGVVDAGSGLEMAAREARYAAFAANLDAGEVLFMAHHQNDQAETLLLRLLRGSGPEGLAGMPVQRALGSGTLCRPLLAVSRAALWQWARDQRLTWIEDPSNQSPDRDRNFLRQQILPQLASRWPACHATLARSAALLRDGRQLEVQALDALLAGRCGSDRYGAYLALDDLEAWPAGLRQALLRRWLAGLGQTMPAQRRLQVLDDEVLRARSDAVGLWQAGALAVSRFRQRLYAHGRLPPAGPVQCWASPQQTCRLADGSHLQALAGQGTRLSAAAFPLTVRYRQGGERCQPVGRAHSQTLKRLLQERAVPPWLRANLPLLYHGDTLVAVADCWVCSGWQADAGQPGWTVHWQLPGSPIEKTGAFC